MSLLTPLSPHIRTARAIPLLIALALSSPLTAQDRDLPTGDLVYGETTIRSLHHIVDSLHAVFNAMPPYSPIVSDDQTIGSFILLRGDSTTIAGVAQELDGGASFEYIATRYKSMIDEMRREAVITRTFAGSSDTDEQTRPLSTTYRVLLEAPNSLYSGAMTLIDTSGDDEESRTSGWICHAGPAPGEPEENATQPAMRLEAILLSRGFTLPITPEPYARMIRYATFMIDSAVRLIPKRVRSGIPGESYDQCEQLLVDMLDFPGRPREADGGPMWNDDERYRRWTNDCDARWRAMAHDPKFVEAVAATAEAAIREDVDDPELGLTVELCLPNDRGLDLVRRLPPQRSCSPRSVDYRQVGTIARLAAVTGHWPLFIKAHLSMLGRAYMLSYDIEQPNRACTDELIAIGMDVPALLLGAWLMPPRTTQAYSWLDGERIAEAAAEPYRQEAIDSTLLAAIQDRSLDDLTRWKAYTLYLASTLRLPPDLRRAHLIDLWSCGDELPGYVHEHLTRLAEWDREEHAGLGLDDR